VITLFYKNTRLIFAQNLRTNYEQFQSRQKKFQIFNLEQIFAIIVVNKTAAATAQF